MSTYTYFLKYITTISWFLKFKHMSLILICPQNYKILGSGLYSQPSVCEFCDHRVNQPGLSSFQFSCSVLSDPATPWTATLSCPSLIPRACSNSCPLSQWCHPAILSCHSFLLPPSIFPSIKVFSNESVLHIRWPKYWSFSFSISPSNEYSRLISFRMYWLDLLAVEGTLKGLLQHHSSKASVLWHSAFFIVQLSHPYLITGKTIALIRWTFVGMKTTITEN